MSSKNAIFPKNPHDCKCDIDFIQQFNKQIQKCNKWWTFCIACSVLQQKIAPTKATAELQHTALFSKLICLFKSILSQWFNDPFKIKPLASFLTYWLKSDLPPSTGSVTLFLQSLLISLLNILYLKHYLFDKGIYKCKIVIENQFKGRNIVP